MRIVPAQWISMIIKSLFETAYCLARRCQVQLKQNRKNHSPSATSKDQVQKPVENKAISVEKGGAISSRFDSLASLIAPSLFGLV
jgi:hypothetical protein